MLWCQGHGATSSLDMRGSRQFWEKGWASRQVLVRLREEVINWNEHVHIWTISMAILVPPSWISALGQFRGALSGSIICIRRHRLWAGVGQVAAPFCFFPLTYWGDSHGSKAPNGHNQRLFHLLISKQSITGGKVLGSTSPTAGSLAFTPTPFFQLPGISEGNAAVGRSLGKGRPFKHSAACLNWGSHSCSLLWIMPGKLVNK